MPFICCAGFKAQCKLYERDGETGCRGCYYGEWFADPKIDDTPKRKPKVIQ